METIADVLFEVFWIVTGLTANIIALVLSFILFVFTVNFLKTVFKKNEEGADDEK